MWGLDRTVELGLGGINDFEVETWVFDRWMNGMCLYSVLVYVCSDVGRTCAMRLQVKTITERLFNWRRVEKFFN